jgi:TRAP-type C4-dicarboxylate transport system permease small subunit
MTEFKTRRIDMKVLDKAIDGMLVFFLASMSIIVAANVFCRFVLNFSLYWADELAQILLVWLTFIGAALAMREKTHYALLFLSDRLEGRNRKILTVIRHILVLGSILSLLYFSTIVAVRIGLWLMPATEISRSLVYSACPVGCLLMLYYATKDSFRMLKGETEI